MQQDFRKVYAANGYGRQSENSPRWVRILRAVVRANAARQERRYERELIRRFIRGRGEEQSAIFREIRRMGMCFTNAQIEQSDFFRLSWDLW